VRPADAEGSLSTGKKQLQTCMAVRKGGQGIVAPYVGRGHGIVRKDPRGGHGVGLLEEPGQVCIKALYCCEHWCACTEFLACCAGKRLGDCEPQSACTSRTLSLQNYRPDSVIMILAMGPCSKPQDKTRHEVTRGGADGTAVQIIRVGISPEPRRF
jgi:hypothetical protein